MGFVPPGTASASGGSKSFPGVGGAIGGISDLIGLFSGIGQQNAETGAINQTGNALTTELGQLGSEGSGLFGNYTSNAQPALNNIIANEPGQIAGLQTGAEGLYGTEAGYGTQLGQTPYPGMIQKEGGLFQSLPAGSIAGQYGNIAQLENWQGLQPKELGEATSVASNAALSAANQLKANLGGIPNAGAAYGEATSQAAQTGMQTALGLGSMAEQQELGAKEAAGQELGQVAGEQLQQAGGEVGATEAAGQQYMGALEGAGGLTGNAASGLAGLSAQDIGLLTNAFGTEANMGQAGLGAQEYAGSDYASILESELGLTQDQQSQNPFGQFGSSIMSLLPLFGVAV